jgi:two-component system sensor histidine kinase EvgS
MDTTIKSAPEVPISHGESVLVVENEVSILKLTVKILDSLGYSVLTANTPNEAIRLAREHIGEIHLLITDVFMPDINGWDLAGRLLTLYPKLKCLFMSGYTANVIAHRGIFDEGVHFIQKPFSKKELAVKIREVLE